jgi:hypothetical protein
LKDCCRRECTESKNSILGSIEELSQGVRAGVFLKTRVVEEKLRKFSALKHWKKAQRYRFAGGQVLRKIILFISQEITKEEIDRSEFSVENSRGSRTVRSLQRSREVTVGRNRTVGSLAEFISGFRELKGRNLHIKTREIAKGEVANRNQSEGI